MLFANIDTILKLSNSPIRTDRSEHLGIDTNETFLLFDTDKFLGYLDTLQDNIPLTPKQLSDIFRNSFTEGHIDWNRD